MLAQRWFIIVLLIACSQKSPLVYADPDPELLSPNNQPNLSTLWGDHREEWKDKGIKSSGFFATTLQQNVGGLSEGFAYTGILSAGWEFDLEKLFNIAGASIYFSGSFANGSDLSSSHIGNTFAVSTVFSGQSLRFYELWWDQKFHREQFDIKTGRISPGNDFGILPIFFDYVSISIDAIPPLLIYNDDNFNAYPIAQWGSRLVAQLSDDLIFRAGVYNGGTEDLGKNSKHGLDFTFQPSHGVLTVAQLDYQWQHAKGSVGLPGELLLGAYYDSSEQPTLKNPLEHTTGNTLFYIATQQMIFQPDGADAKQGLTMWGVYSYAPSQALSLFTQFMGAGLSYHGFFPSRPADVTAIGATKGWFSNDQPGLSFEAVLEVTHAVQINPSFTIQPDLQYIVRPGGGGAIPNAWVFGVMAILQF